MTRYPESRLRAAVALAAMAALAAPAGSAAQVQDAGQAKCITSINKAAAKVASTQYKSNTTCVKNAGKGDEADATSCLSDDDGGKVAAAVAKVSDTFTKSCGTLPDFGPADGATPGTAARDESRALATDVFGNDVTGAVVLASVDGDAAKCQQALLSNTQKLANQMVKDFNACKGAGLKAETLDSEQALAGCLDTVDADAKGKVEKAIVKVDDTLNDTCAGLDLDALFPGFCAGNTDATACVESRARCRACAVVAGADNLGGVCDRFDDGMPGNGSCGTSEITGERVSLPSPAQPAETPGTMGVVVTNPKILTQYPPSGPDLNRADYVRWRLSGPDVPADAILILIPGFGAGVNTFRILAEDLIPKVMADKGIRLEVWAFARRDDKLEDREGAILAASLGDPEVAQDWYYGADLGLTLHPDLVAGPNRRAVFYNTSSDIPFLANFTPQVFSQDIDVVVEAALAVTPNVFLGGHSAGTGFTARYAATDFNLTGMGPPEPGYAKLRGLVLLEGGGGSTIYSSPITSDTVDRIIAKADGGLFGAVRDNAPRCVDGVTACNVLTEAADCFGQVPPKCTPQTTSYTALGGLQPHMYAAGEVAAVQGLKDADSGQVILQVDQGAPGNNAVDVVPGLSPLSALAPATVDGLFGIFLDDEGVGALLSPALATSLGAQGPNVGGKATWIDIDGDGLIPISARPNNGPAPTTGSSLWGQEVEVTRMDRHRFGFISGGENASDWYYAGSGLSTLSVTGVCDTGTSTCVAGNVGASCTTNATCSQSINLDSSPLVAAGRPDIANMTQAGSIDIPVISFGGSNGLTPVGSSFRPFGLSIGTCTAPSCDGSTPRVVNASVPSDSFPTYGNVAGGYEVYISEGYAHVDVVTAEDTEANLIPERIADFLERNLVP